MGCAPISSCRGHPKKYSCYHPHVVFFSAEDAARKLVNLARRSRLEVGLVNENIENQGGLNLFTRDVMVMLDFSREIRNAFGSETKKRARKK